MLEVREARSGGVDVGVCLVEECLLQTGDAGGDAPGVVPQEQPQVGRYLVVAAAPGAKLSPSGPRRSISPRSSAVCTSSSSTPASKRPAATSARDRRAR